MKNPILQYELRHWFKSPMVYFLIASVSTFALVSMIGTGGYFDPPAEYNETTSFLNSAYALTSNSFLFAKLLLFLVALFFGLSLYRDYQDNSHHLLYSYPLRKFQFISGKFMSAGVMIFLSAFLLFLGICIGEFILGTDNPKIKDFQSSAYFIAFFLYVLPTLLITGTFVFIVVGLTRNIYAGFITVICVMLFQLILENTLFNAPQLLAILDPFGQHAFYMAVQHWDHGMRNSVALPFGNIILINRFVWGIISLLLLYVFSLKFDFHHTKAVSLRRRTSSKHTPATQQQIRSTEQHVDYQFNTTSKIKYALQLALFDLKHILRSWSFILLSLFGIAAIFFLLLKVSHTGEFILLPMTRLCIGAPLSIYSLIIIFSTFLFSGLLVERARISKMHLIVDVTPIENWQLISSKIIAILLLHISLLILFLITCITIQLINDYHYFELGLYVVQLFILTLPMLFVWNITSIFFHSIFKSTFVSMFLLACLWMGAESIQELGIDTYLLKFNTLPHLDYSDLNGYGSQLPGYLLVSKYWMTVALLLLPCIHLTWKRGTSKSFSERFNLIKKRVSPLVYLFLIFAALYLVYNTSLLYQEEQDQQIHELSTNQMKSALTAHKEHWQQYRDIVQPKISSIDLVLDLFPKARRFEAHGTYVLTNQSAHSIDTVFIRTGFDEFTEINWNGQADEVLKDDIMKSQLYQLNESLLPGDSISFAFTITNIENNLLGRNSNVLRNGTFLKQDMLPRLGYQFFEERRDMNGHGDHIHHFYHRDAHEVTLKSKISTSPDQIAIAPGNLLSMEVRDGRKHFEYTTIVPQKLNFSFHSADYSVVKDSIGDVKIDVYSHQTHSNKAIRMIAGLKASLAYNSSFNPYPYKQIRIIEFPHTEESYAGTLTGNNIPTSELLFSINDKDMKNQIDLPFYVMAHELTHEWFGNQMKPAAGPGAKMLTESITEYITLCIYEQALGEEKANAFLKTQYERYRKGKSKAKEKEPPLYLVASDQDYIAYGKGAIALNQISKRIGRDKMRNILKLFLDQYGKNQVRYPSSLDFIRLLKSQVSPLDHELINEWLMEVNDFDFEDLRSVVNK